MNKKRISISRAQWLARVLTVLVLHIVCFRAQAESINSTAANAEKSILFNPSALLLTWQRDPTTTMTIDWQTVESGEQREYLEYRKSDKDKWLSIKAAKRPFHKPGTPVKKGNRFYPLHDRIIYRVEVTRLQPKTTFSFRFGDNSRVYKFRTMPKTIEEPLRFAVGGDVRYTEMTEKTNREAIKHDLDFVIWGGDISYGNWEGMFSAIKSTLIGPDGRAIPIIAGIGNHEVAGGYYNADPEYAPTEEWRMSKAFNYFNVFAFPGHPGYNVLDFGNYLSLVLLDTGHANEIKGVQTDWLKSTLKKRRNVTHVFPVYHVPGYPGHRNPGEGRNEMVRHTWGPVFDQYGVRLAFENHDHTYKRTHPIRAGKIDPQGVVYVGDGAWSVETRRARTRDNTWYIANSKAVRHFVLVTLNGKVREFRTIDEDGVEIDRYTESEATRQALIARDEWAAKDAAKKAAAKAAREAQENELKEGEQMPVENEAAAR